MGNVVIGLKFTIIGMGIVFLFLLILVASVQLMKVVISFLDKRALAAADSDEGEIAAVIAAAYAKNKGRQP